MTLLTLTLTNSSCDISFEENKKLEFVNTKINVNIKEELSGEELLPLLKISKHFPPSQPTNKYI
jgi:hypothetical protein